METETSKTEGLVVFFSLFVWRCWYETLNVNVTAPSTGLDLIFSTSDVRDASWRRLLPAPVLLQWWESGELFEAERLPVAGWSSSVIHSGPRIHSALDAGIPWQSRFSQFHIGACWPFIIFKSSVRFEKFHTEVWNQVHNSDSRFSESPEVNKTRILRSVFT